MARRRSWREKHDNHAKPAFVTKIDKTFCGYPPGTRLVVATPGEVSEYFRRVPRGQIRTVDQLRAKLAADHGADAACPMTTGIFCRIAAEAAFEALNAGAARSEVAPFWRVIEPESPLARKLTCGPDFIRRQRDAESNGPV